MLDGQRLERWLWLAAFAAVLLVSRSVSVTIHPAPGPEPATDTKAGIAPSRPDRSRAERELTVSAQALERAESDYRNAQDRLQKFEEQHLEALMGGDSPLLVRKIERDRERLENAASRILSLQGEINRLRFTLSKLDPELIEIDREENPRHRSVVAALRELEAELAKERTKRDSNHPILIEKEKLCSARRAELARTPRYLRNREIRRPNPQWVEATAKLERAESDQHHALQTRLKLSEQVKRLNALPGIRREHRELKDAVQRARVERERARRRHQEALRSREQMATTENV